MIRFSQLKSRTVRAALLVLIQHNLVQHFKSDDDGETVYFNTDECLMRLRFGQLVEIAQQLYGDKVWSIFTLTDDSNHAQAAAIITILLDHGKLRREEILKQAVDGHRGGELIWRDI